MSTNTLSAASDGQVIPAAHHNEIVTALIQDLVPRNTSRIPEDISGQLGTSALRWLRLFSKEFFLGTSSQNLKFYEGAVGEIWIERNSPTKETIKIKDGSIQFLIAGNLIATFDATTLTAPNEYLSYDAIKQKSKINFANVSSGYSASYANTYSHTLNGCIAGKRIKIFANLNVLGVGGASGNIRIRVNTVAIRTWTSIVGPFPDETNKLFLAVHTIPSDGNYTVEVQYQDCEIGTVSEVLIEET